MLASKPKLDLGLRQLLPDWRALFSKEGFREDALAALSVALLAIPLSLAIGLASSVDPAIALGTAIVAGIVGGLFGGTPLAVTGPAAAMAVLVGDVVEEHGLLGLGLVGLAAGLLQVATGVLGFGRLMRLVPISVVEGFTAGIGAIILIGQLPRLLGLAPPPESHVIDVITHIAELVHKTNLASLGLALAALALVLVAPRIHPRAPGPLLGVVVPTVAAAAFGLNVDMVGALPSTFHLPDWSHSHLRWTALINPILMVYALASLESLLSSSAVDRLAKGTRHDPDQEFIGQGLANAASALTGGIPVTSVIARSALNVQAGGRTRRSAIMHALMVAFLVLVTSSLIARIPLAALSGVLFAVALRMLNPKTFLVWWRVSRPDAWIFLVTFVLIVALDLIQGVQWGLAAALLMVLFVSTRAHIRFDHSPTTRTRRLVLDGQLTFLSSLAVDRIRAEAEQVSTGDRVLVDASRLVHVDASGASAIAEVIAALLERDVDVLVVGASTALEQRIVGSPEHASLAELFAHTEEEEREWLAKRPSSAGSRLVTGAMSFHELHRPKYRALFSRLAGAQRPHALFITCADSRVVPSLLVSSEPGDLFTLRNVGNMVPTHGSAEAASVGAAIEYAVGVLGVSDIVVCGHSGCGAIRAVRDPAGVPASLENVHRWLGNSAGTMLTERMRSEHTDDDVGRLNVALQLEHLQTYPVLAEAVSAGKLQVHGWFFSIDETSIDVWNARARTWVNLDAESAAPGNSGMAPTQ